MTPAINDNSLNDDALQAGLASAGLLVIAANRRLVRDLQWRHAQWQQAAGCSVWATPPVYTWDDVLARYATLCLHEADISTLPERVLDDRESLRLWEQIIAQAERDYPLLRHRELAQLAQEAHGFECLYQLPDSDTGNAEYRRYRIWRRQMLASCAKRRWHTSAQWRAQLCKVLQSDPAALLRGVSVNADSQIVLLGFDELAPDLQRVLAAANAQGLTCVHWRATAGAARETLLRYPQTDDELEAAVQWAAAQADAGKRVALVVPDLQAQRVALDRIALRVLHPFQARSPEPLTQGRYNISAAPMLAEQPMVHIALRLLRLLAERRDWSLIDVSLLLRSPYCGDFSREGAARARLDERLRRNGGDQISATRLLGLLAVESQQVAPLLHQQWSAARAQLEQLPARQTPSQWAECIPALLHTAGWPGTRTLLSSEWQTRQALLDVCAQLARWDEVQNPYRFTDALSDLQALCLDTPFQTQANAEALVQILGLLEVSGQRFDAIRILRAQDDLLPAAPRPNSLLPMPLQRAHDLPRSSSAREWAYVQRWRENLRMCTEEIIWTCARFDGEAPLRVSRLLHELPESDAARPATLFAACALEYLQDSALLPVTDAQNLRGGVELLRAQARNPFWAFAQFRLRADSLQALQPFTTPQAHGLLVHAALASIWQQLGDAKNLRALGPAQEEELISLAITQAFNGLAQQNEVAMARHWQQLETQLLQQLLRDWLQYERTQRGDFCVIATEEPGEWTHRGWTLRLRIDRVDALPGGSELVFDYKTGTLPSLTALRTVPLLEPQLALYALLRGENCRGVAYAQLKRGALRSSGLFAQDGMLPKSRAEADWPSLQTQWQNEITGLADALLNGQVRNAFRDKKDLQRSPVLPLLRVVVSDDEDGAGEPA